MFFTTSAVNSLLEIKLLHMYSELALARRRDACMHVCVVTVFGLLENYPFGRTPSEQSKRVFHHNGQFMEAMKQREHT
jgi:hypothetical protein